MMLIHVVQPYDGGGVSRVVVNLIGAFSRLGHYNVVISSKCSKQYIVISNECIEYPIFTLLKPFNSYLHGFLISKDFSEKVRRLPFTPDVIVVHPGWYAMAIRELARRYTNIIVVHGTYLNELHFMRYHPIRNYEKIRYLLGIKLSYQNEMMILKDISTLSDKTAIIAVSERTRRELIDVNIKSHKVYAILNGVSKDIFKPINKADAEEILEKKYGIKIKGATIAHIGLGARKGTHILVKALAMLKKRGVKFTALFVGKLSPNTYKHYVEELIRKLSLSENVKLLGWIDDKDLPYIYNIADITIVPSFSEGSPLVIPESLACGTPVVATNVGGNREYLELVHLNDLLIDLNDYDFSKELFLKLYNVLSSADLIRQKLSSSIEAIPSWESVGMKYLEILKFLY